jgi:hypothetical protein
MFGEEFHGDEDISDARDGVLEKSMIEMVAWNKEQARLQAISNAKNRKGRSRYIAKKAISTGRDILAKIKEKEDAKNEI